MGCGLAKNIGDTDSLLSSDGNNIEDTALFNKLNLVLIGSHCSGKNEVGNVILGHKAFKFWDRFCKLNIVQRESFDRKITLVRVPGWKGDLSVSVNKQNRTKQQLVHSVQTYFGAGPHAVLLVLDVNSTITVTTRKTLENLLGERIWDHTIVIFTHGEKLDTDITIEDQIRVCQLGGLIEQCGKRYQVLRKHKGKPAKQRAEFIETLEYFIADKDAPIQFSLSHKEREKDLEQKKSLIERLKKKITFLRQFKINLSLRSSHYQSLIESKDAEIRRLQNILQKREDDVQRLQTQLKSVACAECQKKDEEIFQLCKIISILKQQKHSQSPDRSQSDRGHLPRTQMLDGNSVELQILSPSSELHSDNLRQWPFTLSNILDELDDSNIRKMKFCLHHGRQWRISESCLEGKDRISLVHFLIQTWSERECIINIRNILKEIPRNDDRIKKFIMPHLEAIGESW